MTVLEGTDKGDVLMGLDDLQDWEAKIQMGGTARHRAVMPFFVVSGDVDVIL